MKKISGFLHITLLTASVTFLILWSHSSKADVVPPSETSAMEETVSPTTPRASAPKAKKAGAQIWAENCARCHNMREPASFSDREWSVIMHHMRVRANLTVEEYESIREFLKAANN